MYTSELTGVEVTTQYTLIDGHNLDTLVKECIAQHNTADTTWDAIAC